jgi:hypothetical protein
LDDSKSEKLEVIFYKFFVFGAIQLLDLLKANLQKLGKAKINIPLVRMITVQAN